MGEEIDVLGESIGDNEPIELDLGTIVGIDDAQSEGDDDDDSGFEVDPAVGLTVPDALTPDDGSEGLDDGSITVDESKFPALEMDDGSEGIAAEREISLGTASDEARVPMAALPWQVAASADRARGLRRAGRERGRRCRGQLGSALVPQRLEPNPCASRSMAARSPIWCSSARIKTSRSPAPRVVSYFAVRASLPKPSSSRASANNSARRTARARSSRSAARWARVMGRVLLWLHDGTLLDVLDAGDRFERLEFDGKVLAVARESATILARSRTEPHAADARPRRRQQRRAAERARPGRRAERGAVARERRQRPCVGRARARARGLARRRRNISACRGQRQHHGNCRRVARGQRALLRRRLPRDQRSERYLADRSGARRGRMHRALARRG